MACKADNHNCQFGMMCLAFRYSMKHGIAIDDQYFFTCKVGTCDDKSDVDKGLPAIINLLSRSQLYRCRGDTELQLQCYL